MLLLEEYSTVESGVLLPYLFSFIFHDMLLIMIIIICILADGPSNN